MNNPYKYVDRDGNSTKPSDPLRPKAYENPSNGYISSNLFFCYGRVTYFLTKLKDIGVPDIYFENATDIFYAPSKYGITKYDLKMVKLTAKSQPGTQPGKGPDKDSGGKPGTVDDGSNKNNPPQIIVIQSLILGFRIECPYANYTEQDLDNISKVTVQCENIYVAYKNKFTDWGLLNAIKKVINDTLAEGIRKRDFAYVEKQCRLYKSSISVPTYNTDDGARVNNGFASLKNSTIRDTFVQDVSGLGSYNFTLLVLQEADGLGLKSTLVNFNASLPIPKIDGKSWNLTGGVSLEFWTISYSLILLPFVIFEVGIFLGIGVSGGVMFFPQTIKLELSVIFAEGVGGCAKLIFDIKGMLGI